ncbi:hypothetical protein E7X23_25270, partial [Bacteroides fragilis]
GGYINHLNGDIPIRFQYSFPLQKIYVSSINSGEIEQLRKSGYINANSDETLRSNKPCPTLCFMRYDIKIRFFRESIILLMVFPEDI